VLLLAAALFGARLVSTLAGQRRGAAARAAESGILYEVAIAAIRERGGAGPEALNLLCRRAVEAGGVEAMALLAGEGQEACVVAGEALSDADLRQARWAAARGLDLGARVHDGEIPPDADLLPAPRAAGWWRCPGGWPSSGWPPTPRSAATSATCWRPCSGLAGLLLDRRRAGAAVARCRSLEASDRLKSAALSSVSQELETPIASAARRRAGRAGGAPRPPGRASC